MTINVKIAVASLFLLSTALPAMAGAWGALATSPNADYGWSKNYDSEDEAADRALRECRKYSRECSVKRTFSNVCISVASSTNGAMGWAWGYGRREGNRRAMDECRSNRGRSCRLVERFCTGDAED
jgi:hypothetical protein